MARKNIFDLPNETPSDGTLTGVNKPTAHPQEIHGRPLAGMNRTSSARPAALGAISQSLEKINARSARADEIEHQLKNGVNIIELDVDLLDSSFVTDRLEFDDEEQRILVNQIRDSGQLVPIMVRPHPNSDGRFQIAYGHRRVAALKELGLKAKAIVRELTDEELVINQGQENNTRSNLSFIERAFFITTLDKKGFSRDTIFQSTGIDKAIISKMTSIVNTIPEDIIRKIGRAPTIGRTRWEEFVKLYQSSGGSQLVLTDVNEPDFTKNKSSDERFQLLLDRLKANSHIQNDAKRVPVVKAWVSNDNSTNFSMNRKPKRVDFTIKGDKAGTFGDWLSNHLGNLYDEYIKSEIKHGD